MHSFCEIEGAVVLPYVDIGRSARLSKVVIDRGVQIPRAFWKLIAYRDAAAGGRLAAHAYILTQHDLLKQVEGTDVNVYTHGEMLPAHMYPRLREHPNLAGHYGGPWQKLPGGIVQR